MIAPGARPLAPCSRLTRISSKKVRINALPRAVTAHRSGGARNAAAAGDGAAAAASASASALSQQQQQQPLRRRQGQLQQHEQHQQQHQQQHGGHQQSPGSSSSSSSTDAGPLLLRPLRAAAAAALLGAALALAPLPAGGPLTATIGGGAALAADVAKVGTCLLSKCQLALARCVADGQCLSNLVCLNLCNGAKDETACQIKCGDQYGDAAIDAFNACAISDQKCVPQRADEGLFPEPPAAALDANFDLSRFTGRWFITAGLNPLFDTFDCQEHFFITPEPDRLQAQINWRIRRPKGDFLERSTLQNFKQDPEKPGVLYNRGNEYLHYEDTWYVVGSKPDSYVFVYYRGNNDAWRGYGGAVVYTRARSLPAELIPELRAQAAAANMDWDDFTVTDNKCGPRPPAPPSLLAEVEGEVEDSLRSFGKGFTIVERRLAEEVAAEEKVLEDELRAFERALERVERSAAAKVAEEEEAVVRGVEGLLSRLFGGGGGAK